MSMSLAATGKAGSRNPVTQMPWETRLRVLGVKSNAIAVGVTPVPVFSSTEMVLSPSFAVARSALPSPFRSPTATVWGKPPVP